VALHAFIMVLQFVSGDFAQAVYALSGYTRAKSYRVTGLTISYNALNLVQGFGLLLAIVLQQRFKTGWRRAAFAPATAFILGSMMVAGRTAAAVMLTFCLIALVIGMRRFLFRLSTLVFLLALGAVAAGVIMLIPADDIERFRVFTLWPIIEPIEMYLRFGSVVGTYGMSTLDTLMKEMWFFPQEGTALLFGSSHSGRGDAYIPSDIGWVLFIHGIGVIGTLGVALLYVHMLVLAARWTRFDRWIGYAMAAFTLAVMILHLKEQSLLTRHAYTISALLISWYYILRADPQLRSARHLIQNGGASRDSDT
jgi:hypothetical protein